MSEVAEALSPLAKVRGEPVTELPRDLYIPPDALEVFLDAFEGPLDLLLYLIKRQNLDILDIPIAEITRQYMDYVEWMKGLRLELAAEYLVMAAVLAEVKSRMLLPRPPRAEDDEADPRAELVRRLQEYERFKKAAEDIDALPQVGREIFPVHLAAPQVPRSRPQPQAAVSLPDLLRALKEVMERAEMFSHHRVQLEPLSVRERMSEILERSHAERFTPFTALFTPEEGRLGVVVSFLAILELIKDSVLELLQTAPYGPIYVRVPPHADAADSA
ncbi:MAG TPA: segregation/condensation protein A [Gammaproteobacteria bacterium]|nr:segregation/condensation protein A [Gammaproteobacteria bacterium]